MFEKKRESRAGRRASGEGEGEDSAQALVAQVFLFVIVNTPPFLFRRKTGVPRQDSSSCCSVEMGPMGSRRLTGRGGLHTLWPRCHDIMTKDQCHEGPLPGGLAAAKGGRRPVAH